MFVIRGLTLDGREAEVSWHPLGRERVRAAPKNRRGLVGEDDLIQRAINDELDDRTFRATHTGPFFRADLDDAHVAVLQLGSYFRPGSYEISGEWPRSYVKTYLVAHD